MTEPPSREELLERLGRETFDLAVIGGGITGAGIAHDAALRGLSVALLEKGDFGSGTSGRSARLIHGGLRYLRHRKLRLVREALRERYHLLRLAPHLVRPIPFVIPVYEDSKESPLLLRLGLVGYQLLAGAQGIGGSRTLSKEALASTEPQLRAVGLRAGLRYFDALTDDARLTLAVALSALRRKAAALNYVEAVGLERTGNRVAGVHYRDLIGGGQGTVRARIVVNATGPWTDQVRELAEASELLRPTKGIHVVVPRARLATNSIVIFAAGQRELFAVPHGEHTYIGTTDTDYADVPDNVEANHADVSHVLAAANDKFDAGLSESDVVATWAGVRPLLADVGAPSDVSRDYAIVDGPPGLVTITGGKLTTFRSMAEHLVDHVLEREGHLITRRPGPCRTLHEPLVGGETKDFDRLKAAAVAQLKENRVADDATAERLVNVLGTAYAEAVAGAEQRPDLLAPLVAGCPVLGLEAAYAAQHEMVVTLEDFMRRRSGLMLFGEHEDALAAAAAELLARELGWRPEETQRQLASYRRSVEAMLAFRRAPQPASHS